MQKLIKVNGNDTAELNNYLANGWKVTNISSTSTSCVCNSTPYFQSFGFVIIEKQ